MPNFYPTEGKLAVGETKLNINYQDTMAQLTRDQWADFQQRYLPVQNELLALATNDNLLNEQMSRNESNINNSFAVAKQNENNRLSRYGQSPSNTAQSSRNTSLLKNLTTASVNNETRQAVDDLQNKIITGQGGALRTLADIGARS
ncbi:MAG: hypothetical protein HRU25_16630 [Psychrobium sp.]|nr:hypothetical protein [Psychrobium sp.]